MSAEQDTCLSLEHAHKLSSLFEDYRKNILGFLYLKTGNKNKDLAEDLTAQVFDKVMQALINGTYRSEGRDMAWLLRIAHNVFIDDIRKSKKLPIMRALPGMENDPIDNIGDRTLNYEETYINAEISREVRILIDELPIEQKEVVILRMYKKLAFKEIAEFQEVSINTSLGRMRYALINLRRLIREKGINLDGYAKPG